MKKVTIHYATTSVFKREELAIISKEVKFRDRNDKEQNVGDFIQFQISATTTNEPLEIDLEKMVRHKVRSAYQNILIPCIVEHAGLILDAHSAAGFPGGLTQPMWDSLQADGFLARTGSAGEGAVAKAVVGYCDGKSIKTFVGETHGTLSLQPRGDRNFYWDTIFCPPMAKGEHTRKLLRQCPMVFS